MNNASLSEYIRKAVPGLIALYRFGSHAQGTARPGSDVDLAVLAQAPIPAMRVFELAQELALHLHRDVDLVDLRRASDGDADAGDLDRGMPRRAERISPTRV